MFLSIRFFSVRLFSIFLFPVCFFAISLLAICFFSMGLTAVEILLEFLESENTTITIKKKKINNSSRANVISWIIHGQMS